MFSLPKASLCLVALLGVLSNAQVVQDDWLAPAFPDKSAALTVGTTYTVRWTRNLRNWFSSYATDANPANCDLWVVGGDSDEVHHQIATGLNLNTTTSYTWNVDVTDDDLETTTVWRFRFRRSGFNYPAVSGDGEIASPGFIMRADPNANTGTTISTTTTSTSATATTTGTGSSTPTTSSSTSTSPTGSVNSGANSGTTSNLNTTQSSGLSGGAIGGIVIGAVAVIALIAAAAFIYTRRRSRDAHGNNPAPAYPGPQYGNEAGYAYNSTQSATSQYKPPVGAGMDNNREYYKPAMQQGRPSEMPAYGNDRAQTRYAELQ